MRLIRVMCSGRVDMGFVLRAFANGADGVFIGGCRLNECNYTTHGNYHTLTMVLLLKRIMEHLGLNPERLRIEFMSAGEGILFADVMNKFSRSIKELGPLGRSEGLDEIELKSRLAEVCKLVPYIKLAKREKLARRLHDEAEYDRLFARDEVEDLFRDVISYYIQPEKCQACMICLRKCPVEAITGGKNLIHVIDQETCIRCGTCFDACPSRFGAVARLSGKPVPNPLPEEERSILRKSKRM
jgi:coenzyme F420-reducing hydrogenase delta subunit/Fe-S-cluster-containing hydrogenase component 2